MAKAINKDTIEIKTLIYAAQSLLSKIEYDEYEEEVEVANQVLVRKVQRLSSHNDPKIINSFFDVVSKLTKVKNSTLDNEDFEMIKKIIEQSSKMAKESIIKELKVSLSAGGPKSNHTIEYIVDSMLTKANNTKVVTQKKRQMIKNLIEGVGLKLTDEYSKFYKDDIIRNICDNIKAMGVKGSVKRTYAREIRNLIEHANTIDPDTYKKNLINLVPNFKKTSKDEMNPHWPFSDDELKQIFNPANDYFKNNPDVFWTTLIGMFVGARCNAAITLQYGDIITVDDIKCIKFQNNHQIKQLKNQASIRTVPIPQQLLDLGFVEYVNRQRNELNAKTSAFIFPRCQTQKGNYNNKFTTRGFIKYIQDIGITNKNPHKLDFHSLCKNANLRLEKVGVPETFINDIIGWEGNGTRQQSYSNHEIKQIKEQADKLRYDFLEPEFKYWKKVMAKK